MPKDKAVALVTGGAKRVGRAIVQQLAHHGFHIAFTYLHSGVEAAGLRKWLYRRTGRSGVAIQADLRDPPQAADHIHQQLRNNFDRLDVLVNNASIYRPARLQHTDLTLMQDVMAVHVHAPLLLCQRFETMLRASRGHIINMCDLLAERPWPEYLVYCASKAALVNLTLGLARELAPDVTVNGIAPGVIEWPEGYPEEQRRKYLQRVPLKRAGTPEEAASLVHFLVSGADYITGQIIRLDGGRSIT